ncbi:MAG: HPr(Ser) kinase/phosphatase [Blastocatellia bacterium]|nr:HPr(Ser) kinase/phosphatase [Blastocatellia bacterium]MCS7156243.1 HPr(Ser) kinase/phosphatase [Blastocatellia bacterium]MCX7751407.1 HPr(Ser) kinase/phosphatase [Blastocatellia bacterium]MDW8169120.1 HPr(Ser) kinase/phosphatase [Acidobacteriota bacterium]MDW8255824.1 HPr(Ser) kinase/phosphatase [Acidobacteriota bacterium]
MTTSFVPEITVAELLAQAPPELELRVIAGAAGAANVIRSPRIQKLGLALAGFPHYVHPGRVQILGQSEVTFLQHLSPSDRRQAVERLPWGEITCVLVTKGLTPPPEFLDAAERRRVPVLVSSLLSSMAILKLTEFLQRTLAPRQWIHGVMVEVFGVGVLLLGESGLGKSECALDLIQRGHRLVSDDVVEVRALGSDRVIGRAPERAQGHMEIRGLGILDIRELFGVAALAEEAPLELAIAFERWDPQREYDPLGLQEETLRVLDVPIPLIRLPITSWRNLPTLVEVAVRNHLLRRRGIDAMRRFVRAHDALVTGEAQDSR